MCVSVVTEGICAVLLGGDSTAIKPKFQPRDYYEKVFLCTLRC